MTHEELIAEIVEVCCGLKRLAGEALALATTPSAKVEGWAATDYALLSGHAQAYTNAATLLLDLLQREAALREVS